ncbi:MAG: glycosyltransferase family 4 protein [Nitrospinae bacterium]|nr:glycosyltransferase family 4 protein [Nitrospinota bacterium]
MDKKKGFDLNVFMQFYKKVVEFSPDILVSFDNASNLYASIASILQKVPWVASVHGLEGAFHPSRAWLNKIIFKVAKKVVAPSNAVKEKLIKENIVSGDKVQIIYNGVEVKESTPVHAKERKDIIVGCVANFYSEIKGHRYFLEALAQLSGEYKGELIGDGILKPRMEELAQELKVNDRVRFRGRLGTEEVHRSIAGMDVIVIPSLSESFCLVAVEAMALGVPVVASNVGGLKEIIDNGVSGILTSPEKPAEICESVINVSSDPALKEGIIKAARKRVKEMFSIDAFARGYEALFHTILNK